MDYNVFYPVDQIMVRVTGILMLSQSEHVLTPALNDGI